MIREAKLRGLPINGDGLQNDTLVGCKFVAGKAGRRLFVPPSEVDLKSSTWFYQSEYISTNQTDQIGGHTSPSLKVFPTCEAFLPTSGHFHKFRYFERSVRWEGFPRGAVTALTRALTCAIAPSDAFLNVSLTIALTCPLTQALNSKCLLNCTPGLKHAFITSQKGKRRQTLTSNLGKRPNAVWEVCRTLQQKRKLV